jgi:hypothetical protein
MEIFCTIESSTTSDPSPELQQNVSMQSGQEDFAVDKDSSRTLTSVCEVYTQYDLPVVKKCYSLGS